jgi:hypothetical protein
MVLVASPAGGIGEVVLADGVEAALITVENKKAAPVT